MGKTTFELEQARERNRKYQKRYLENLTNREKHQNRVKESKKEWRILVKKLIAEFKSDGCELCDESEPCCLSAHHKNPSEKKFEIGNAVRLSVSPQIVMDELDKCFCLCHNCHAKVHAGIMTTATIRR